MSEKIFSFPADVKALNLAPEEPEDELNFLDKERLRLEREDRESQFASGSIESIVLDNSNEVNFPGFPYTFRAIGEIILVSIDIPLSGFECKKCNGKKRIEVKEGREAKWEICSECKGFGGKVIMPKGSKQLPRTGIILSMGKKAAEKLAEEDIKIGDRILFSEHAGSMIPTKADLMFKYMDWYNAVLKVGGADVLSAFDFILQEKE